MKTKGMKKILSASLIVAMMFTSSFGNVTIAKAKSEVSAKKSNNDVAMEEIKNAKSSLSQKELYDYSIGALKDEENVAKKINKIEDEKKYEDAVDAALTSLYKENDNQKINNFEK